MPEQTKELGTADALEQWRTAERAVAVARRGRLSAQVAAEAAAEAAEAAKATSVAAKAALESMMLAEKSAAKTAATARMVVQSTLDDVANADADVALTEIDEAEAQGAYKSAARRARERAAEG
jgi:hypothetical protein